VDVHVDEPGKQRDIAEIDDGGVRRRAGGIDGLNHAAGDDQDSGRKRRDRYARRACRWARTTVVWGGSSGK